MKNANQGGNRTLKQGAYSDIERGDYSDFKVKCFEKVFYLHRASVCPQSRFFAAALRPGSFLESKTAEVLLPEDDPRIFAFLLQLMYLGEIDADSISKPEGVIDYVKLYVMTDKYGGPGIIASAFEHAQAQISIVLFELSTAKGDMADNDNQNTWDIFAEVVEYVYSNLPSSVDQLKCSLVKDAASKWKDLSTDKQILKDFLRAVPEFAVDILSVPAMLNNIN